MREFLLGVIIITSIFAGIAGLIAIAVNVTDYVQCRGFSNGTGIETRWEWGCYANVDGKWIPAEYVFGKANEIRLKDGRK